jgi:hypothetical protein
LPGVLEDVETVVAVARGDVLLAVPLEHLDAPEIVAALVDEASDLLERALLDLCDPEPSRVLLNP